MKLQWKIKTQREAIAEMRADNIRCLHERTVLKRFDGFVPKWITPWLAKSDEEHMKTDDGKKECNNCEKHVNKWVETSFSFCDEYDCGIAFCEKCSKELGKIWEVAK